MTRKILAFALITFSLTVSGCQELPPAPPNQNPPAVQPENPNSKIENDKPENPKTTPENPNTDPPKIVSPATQTQAQKIKVKAYFPDDAGINLVAVNRTIEVNDESEKYLAAVQLLTQNPNEKDLTAIFPKNAKINSVKFENGTAFVDFDKNITKSFAGGSTGEELLVSSVVKTLTEFKEIKQVKFLIDGEEVETLSGHMDLSEPIKKTDL